MASVVWSRESRWMLDLVVSEHRSQVMSQDPSDEEVDSYVPPGGSIPASGVLSSDAECASRVGQAAAGPAGPNQDVLDHQLFAALRQVAGAIPQASIALVPVPVRLPIEKLRKYVVVKFMGRKDDMAFATENWLQSLERSRFSAEERTWDFFLFELRQKYIGELFIDQRRAEFLKLKQDRMTVSRLSRYAADLIRSELDKCKHFRKGLHDEYMIYLVAHPHTSLSSLVKAALELEEVRTEQ
ncbi:hypothetical protein JCGZ_13738 [Jatropha curcas]|uniref:Retrotransposon gag domain-containing protein n=1 Tax=Jatropha curcas TaxID=180498 RepID=A0A067KEX3_JATCU|nr:hypothetical protein JCGZ_13738 [Jatropha curcas]